MDHPTAGELRARVNKSIRQNRVMMWLCGVQSVVGAGSILLSDGLFGWIWFILGFLLMFLYAGLIAVNRHTLTLLEGIPDDV